MKILIPAAVLLTAAGLAACDRPTSTSTTVVKEPTTTAGVFKVTVKGADAQGRWKPETSHEYFGIAVDGGYKGGPIWAVKIK